MWVVAQHFQEQQVGSQADAPRCSHLVQELPLVERRNPEIVVAERLDHRQSALLVVRLVGWRSLEARLVDVALLDFHRLVAEPRQGLLEVHSCW